MTHSPDCMIHEHQPPGPDGWHDCTCHVFNAPTAMTHDVQTGNEVTESVTSGTASTPAHDPLCYMAEGKWGGGCQCGLIARVRNHERMKIFANLEGLPDREHTDYCRDLTCGGCVEAEE